MKVGDICNDFESFDFGVKLLWMWLIYWIDWSDLYNLCYFHLLVPTVILAKVKKIDENRWSLGRHQLRNAAAWDVATSPSDRWARILSLKFESTCGEPPSRHTMLMGLVFCLEIPPWRCLQCESELEGQSWQCDCRVITHKTCDVSLFSGRTVRHVQPPARRYDLSKASIGRTLAGLRSCALASFALM